MSAAELAKKLEGKEIIIFSVFLLYYALSQLMELKTIFLKYFPHCFRVERENANKSPFHQNSNFVNEEITDLKLS